VFIVPESTEGSGIRSLRIGQRVVFDVDEADQRRVARNLRIITFS
jgi:cold shock CspA family protein